MSLKIPKTPITIGKHLAVLGAALGMLTLLASSPRASVLQSAQVFVSPNCNTYSIIVTGTELDLPNLNVVYSFTITSGFSTITVNDSVPVVPNDQAGDFQVR